MDESINNLQQKSLNTLRMLYQEIIIERLGTDYDRNVWNKLDEPARKEEIQIYKYLKDKLWITYTPGKGGRPENIQFTLFGMNEIEGDNQLQPAQTIINVTKNNGVVSSQANHFSINIGCTFLDIEKLLDQHVQDAEEKKELQIAIDLLKDRLENEKPLEKGLLSRISAHLEQHSWLSNALANVVIGHLLRG